MSIKKQTQDAPALGDEMRRLYDAFMFQVEPDLLSDSVPYLEEIYLDETKAEHVARMHRYAEAFEMFAAFLSDAGQNAEQYFLGIKKAAMSEYAKNVGVSDKNTIDSLEKTINDDVAPNR